MALRLRQRDDRIKAFLEFKYYRASDGYFAGSTMYKSAYQNLGTAQLVRDDYTKFPIVRGIKRKKNSRVKRKTVYYNRMVPMHDFAATKIVGPTDSEPFRMTYNDGYYKYKIAGENPLLQFHPWFREIPYDPTRTLTEATRDTRWESYAYQKVLSKINSAEINLGMPLGELAETVHMLASPLKSIVKLSRKYIHSRIRKVGFGNTAYTVVEKRPLSKTISRDYRKMMEATKAHPVNAGLRIVDESADYWLGYKFGVLPLLDTIGEVFKLQQEGVDPITGIHPARVRLTASDKTYTQQSKVSVGNLDMVIFDHVRDILEYSCGAYYRANIGSPLVSYMGALGVAPWQWSGLAYELIPLSFVVDRFIDIKSFIYGNMPNPYREVLGVYTTTKRTVISTSTMVNLSWRSIVPIKQEIKPVRTTAEQMIRCISPERPLFPVVNPRWRENLTLDATNLALIWGRLRGIVG